MVREGPEPSLTKEKYTVVVLSLTQQTEDVKRLTELLKRKDAVSFILLTVLGQSLLSKGGKGGKGFRLRLEGVDLRIFDGLCVVRDGFLDFVTREDLKVKELKLRLTPKQVEVLKQGLDYIREFFDSWRALCESYELPKFYLDYFKKRARSLRLAREIVYPAFLVEAVFSRCFELTIDDFDFLWIKKLFVRDKGDLWTSFVNYCLRNKDKVIHFRNNRFFVLEDTLFDFLKEQGIRFKEFFSDQRVTKYYAGKDKKGRFYFKRFAGHTHNGVVGKVRELYRTLTKQELNSAGIAYVCKIEKEYGGGLVLSIVKEFYKKPWRRRYPIQYTYSYLVGNTVRSFSEDILELAKKIERYRGKPLDKGELGWLYLLKKKGKDLSSIEKAIMKFYEFEENRRYEIFLIKQKALHFKNYRSYIDKLESALTAGGYLNNNNVSYFEYLKHLRKLGVRVLQYSRDKLEELLLRVEEECGRFLVKLMDWKAKKQIISKHGFYVSVNIIKAFFGIKEDLYSYVLCQDRWRHEEIQVVIA